MTKTATKTVNNGESEANLASNHTSLLTSARDDSLDYLKGCACVMMLMAHVPPIFIDSLGAWLLRWIAGMVPVLFFGVAAETALIQLRRYGFKATIIIYLWLFLLGANLVAMVLHKGAYDHFRYIEILQIIALGALFLLLLEHFLAPSRWVYLALAVAILALKFGIDRWGAALELPNALVVQSGSIEYKAEGDAMQFPGFPLIAWLWVFPLVQFLRRSCYLTNLLVVLLCAVGITILAVNAEPPLQLLQGGGAIFGKIGQIYPDEYASVGEMFVRFQLFFNKWELSLAYVLAMTLCVALFMALFGTQDRLLGLRPLWLIALGKRAFAFLYLHFLGLMIATPIIFTLLANDSPLMLSIPVLAPIRQYILWAVSLMLTIGFLRLLQLLPRSRFFASSYTWWGLACLIYLAPVLIPEFGFVWLAQFIMGLFFVHHFPMLTEQIRRRYPISCGVSLTSKRVD